MKRIFSLLPVFITIALSAIAQEQAPATGLHPGDMNAIVTGAERIPDLLSQLKGKKLAIFANHTSQVKGVNLVDFLHSKGLSITVVFGPEHGFRGTADAGEKVGNYKDEKTGIPVVSLYGSKRRPSAEDLKQVDLMIFDIQDVGTRFYTYISSLEEYMIAASENGKPLLLLDRPNPNGFYVDGPVLDTAFRSFVGMQPVPIVYGMSMGEYAKMLVGQKWIKGKFSLNNAVIKEYNNPNDLVSFLQNKGKVNMMILPCLNYQHSRKYVLPVKPSPNLPDIQSIYCYPSTCFFEGTVLSEGRGTPMPFRIFGHPSLPSSLKSFTPRGIPGAVNPKLKDQLCYGWEIDGSAEEILHEINGRIQLKWLLEAYRLFPQKDSFFLNKGAFFNKLAGNATLQQQLKDGKTEEEIRASWEPGLKKFRSIRKKYLIYPEF